MSLRKCCLLLASLALVWGAWCLSPVQPEATLRLHVIANSDSPQDQAAKLRVRDAILAYVPKGWIPVPRKPCGRISWRMGRACFPR